MIGYVKFEKDEKDRKTYYCAHCGAFIADSGAIVRINGAEDHSFVNPAGVQCNFTTFAHCDNVTVHENLYLEHSWFSGYGWRFVLCSICLHHLGWKYDAMRDSVRPRGFFGILIGSVDSVEQKE